MTRAEAIKKQQELLDAAKLENRDLTSQEQDEYDRLQRYVDEAETGEENSESQSEFQENEVDEGIRRAVNKAVDLERKRSAEITQLCRSFGLDPGGYIRDRKSIEEVRAAVLDHLQKTGTPISIRVTEDEGDKFRERSSDALIMRAGFDVPKPADGAQQMRGMSLRDFAVECLAREGMNTNELLHMDRSELYYEMCRQFYNPTAAFPAILDDTIRKSIVYLYDSVPTTFQVWTTKGSLSDFKSSSDHEYIIGGTGDFLIVPENGELKADTPSTKLLPSRKLDTYGRQFSMSRQAFINDDISFLTKVPGQYASSAKKTIDKGVYTLMYKNEKIFDGVNLFDGKHNNLMISGSKPTQKAVQEIILQMQKQKDPFGDAIYITPQYIIVPVGYEFDLAVLFHSSQVTGSNHNDINPLYNYPLTVVQTPVLNALAGSNAVPWFMVANSASARGIQVDYLNGQEIPTIRRMEKPGVLGFSWDIYLDWGISVRDFRGIAKNPGVAIG